MSGHCRATAWSTSCSMAVRLGCRETTLRPTGPPTGLSEVSLPHPHCPALPALFPVLVHLPGPLPQVMPSARRCLCGHWEVALLWADTLAVA